MDTHAAPNTPHRPTTAHNARPLKKTRPPLAPGLWTLEPRRLNMNVHVVDAHAPAPPAPNPAHAAQQAFDDLCLATN
jgi:hypothetical protein